MRAALLALAIVAGVVSFACSGSPSAPTPKAPDAAVVPVSAPGPTPPVPDGVQVRTFAFVSASAYAVRDYTKASQFLLSDNGSFTLHYPSGDYRGTYTESAGTIAFEWEAGSRGGPWAATGTLVGDTLTLKYNLIMELSDFEDAVYALKK